VNLVLPVVLVAGAAAYYLHSVPAGGNDIVLDVTLAAADAALGTLCALTLRMRRDGDGVALARAGWLSAVLWVIGIGARMGVAFSSDHGAGPAIARFSLAHSITGANAWVAALVLMALAEVIARLIVMRVRGRILPAASPAPLPARARA
jgi:hypothetical protein